MVKYLTTSYKQDMASGKMKHTIKYLVDVAMVTTTGIVKEFMLEICMNLILLSMVVLFSKETDDGLGVETLIPIMVMIH